MYFKILGPLTVSSESANVTISSGRHRKILVTLLLDINNSVSVERLVDVLWAEDPPATAIEQVQNCAGALRRLFSSTDATVKLVRKPKAYLLQVDEDRVDARVFQKMVEDARRSDSEGAFDMATEKLRAAIGLWYGDAFQDVASDALRGRAARLEELRMQAVLRYVELETSSGNHGRAISELRAWTETYPFHEGLCGQLMGALHETGRSTDALEVYRRMRSRLRAELGLEPGEKLRLLEKTIRSSRTIPTIEGRSDRTPTRVLHLVHEASSMLTEALHLLAQINLPTTRSG